MNTLDTWKSEIHETVDQIKRILNSQKIKNDHVTFDLEQQKAVISGSADEPYNVSLDSCTCHDFLSRGLPCKHIYLLAKELNCCPELTSINRKVSKAFKESIDSEINHFYQLYKEGAISPEKFVKIANAIKSGK